MNFIPALAAAVIAAFKADPKKVAHLVIVAIGYLTVSLEAANLVIPQAIAILRGVLTTLPQ